MKKAIALGLLVMACGGRTDPELRPVNGVEPRSCGAWPDINECVMDANLTEVNDCPTYVCDGWPEGPEYNSPDEYAQFVAVCEDARYRTIIHVSSLMSICEDSST